MSDLILEIKSFTIKEFRKRQNLPFKKIGEDVLIPNGSVTNSTIIPGLKDYIQQSFEHIKSKNAFSDDFLSLPAGAKQKKLKLELLEVDPVNSCVHGIYTGGITGDEGNFNKKNKGSAGYKKTPLELEDFVDTPFFFTLYFPINSDTGILITQKYGNHRSMTQEFRALLSEMFHIKNYTLRYNPFVTQSMKDKFSKNPIVERVTFTQTKAGKNLNEQFLFLGEDKQYKIKVEISEIDTPLAKFIDNVKKRTKKELNISEYAEYFPELSDFGFEQDKTKLSTKISGTDGGSNVPLSEVSNYLDKLLPKITVPEKLKVTQSGDTFTYDLLKAKLISILNTEVIPTLEGNATTS